MNYFWLAIIFFVISSVDEIIDRGITKFSWGRAFFKTMVFYAIGIIFSWLKEIL